MPDKTTVLRWVYEHEEFHNQYTRARTELLEYWADEIVDISEDGSNDWYERETKNGNSIRVVDREHVSRSKLRVDTRKWLLSKLAPKKYGERVTQEVSGPGSGPIQTEAINFDEIPVDKLVELRQLVATIRAGTNGHINA